ncbi:MAG: alpha-E domain-containing protein [Ilumatobacter sp.]|uniref:alpha-E domain-containing protein n=1 Tax=Ilumatobacter sp. TaxID=1967498 RepID=UPI0026234C45|nr:alpha-E domain-containing protein [Ilumatobacter sp.]MDJ0769962.1 alpha-E domain-containing protein [Ilumatobacter sp.]
MALLARTADRLYWGARYTERAEDTARIVRAYNDLVVDSPSVLRWEPLAVIAGSNVELPIPEDDPEGERTVLRHLIADRANPSSVRSAVTSARENLRTTREVLPREAWQSVNQLSQYVDATAGPAVERQLRDRFLVRVIETSRRLDGVLESTMTRANPYRMFRLGRLVERADMTTRVLGVAAAGILSETDREALVADEVRWMSVLRSVSALQMYQRATHGPIDGIAVVRFLLGYSAFPRSVQGCFDAIRTVLLALPEPQDVIVALTEAEEALAVSDPRDTEGAELDRAMDQVQVAIARLHDAIVGRYVDV